MRPVPRCPLAPGEPCTLCKPGATGPESCPTVWLVMQDPDLRTRLAELRQSAATSERSPDQTVWKTPSRSVRR